MRHFLRCLLLVVLLLLVAPMRTRRVTEGDSIRGACLFCTLALPPAHAPFYYAAGYHYELLKAFAAEHDCPVDIRLAGPEESPLDSLLEDCTDLVALSLRDSALASRSHYASLALADSSVWVVGNADLRKEINIWLSHYLNSPEHQQLRERFSPNYDPVKRLAASGRSSRISPYDDLFRRYAGILGWDWRLLTALVWQESKFHIEARSYRGAAGLMQMMPSTALRHGVEDPLDPEANLAAGVRYLERLERFFAPYVSREELPKFTLAAYNAGEGRILDCIRYAAAAGKPADTWEDIQALLPDMREESILQVDTVRLGIFKGYETLRYVDSVDSLYRAFRLLSPDAAPRAVSDTIPRN